MRTGKLMAALMIGMVLTLSLIHIFSDDISEILMNCNRILIIKNGRIISRHRNTELDSRKLQALITGGEEMKAV